MLTNEEYSLFTEILKKELIPAMGCTEPIAIAYAAARAKSILGEEPKIALLEVSGNIVKNVKSVVVPHTGGLRGLKAAFAVGILAGNADKELEVISEVDPCVYPQIKEFAESFNLQIQVPKDAHVFDIAVSLQGEKHTAYLRIVDHHLNVIRLQKDGEILLDKPIAKKMEIVDTLDYSVLSVEKIIEYANTVHLEEVKPTLDRQISYNMAIAEEGMKKDYGSNIGKILLEFAGDNVRAIAKAYAAAGSDARMNGCELPVVINSGSGNQGLTASVPVIVYARKLRMSEEKLYRALCVSNLITIHLKAGIGALSAYCGAVSAGAGAGCGVAYLRDGGVEEVSACLTNALAIDSGIICDGAKSSCAAKIATAVEGGFIGLSMYYHGKNFRAGDGIVKEEVENTIDSVARIARIGMKETDVEIIKIMTE